VTQAVRTGTPLNQSIERAARMLGLFSPERPELTLADMTVAMDTSKAATHRYALALRHAGLLRYDAARQVYTLGPRIVELAASALAGLRIIKVAGPHMERLVALVNETVVLSVWDGESPVVVRVEDNTDRVVRIVVRTGTRLPPSSAQGKVFAAFGAFGAFGPSVILGAGSTALDRRELARLHRHRVAVNSQVVQGIRAIATPVFQNTELAASIAIVGTTAGVPEDPRSPLAAALRHAAEALSAELGFLPTDATDATEVTAGTDVTDVPTERSAG
jgi:DNA-binding IclR family transcriptional regulator